LFDDILAVYRGVKTNHVLNFFTIFYDKEIEKKEIFDGQQRTVSLLIILCVLKKELKEIDEELAQEIEETYFIKKKKRTASFEYKLTFDFPEANEFFNNYIVKDETDVDKLDIGDYTKSLKRNYDETKRLVKKFLRDEIHQKINQAQLMDIEDLPLKKQRTEALKMLNKDTKKYIILDFIETMERKLFLITLQT